MTTPELDPADTGDLAAVPDDEQTDIDDGPPNDDAGEDLTSLDPGGIDLDLTETTP